MDLDLMVNGAKQNSLTFWFTSLEDQPSDSVIVTRLHHLV